MINVCLYRDGNKCKLNPPKICNTQVEKECDDRIVMLDTGEIVNRKKDWKQQETVKEETLEGLLDQNVNTVIARLKKIGLANLSQKDREALIEEETEGKNRKRILAELKR